MEISLKKKILSGLVPIGIITIVCMYILISLVQNASNKKQMNATIVSKTSEVSNQLDNWLNVHEEIVKTNKESYRSAILAGIGTDNSNYFLSKVLEPYPEFIDLYIWDDNIKTIYSGTYWDPGSSWDGSTRDWYIKASNSNGVVLTDPYVDDMTHDVCVTASVAFPASNGKVTKVFAGDISISKLQDILDEISFTKNSYIFLVNPVDGLIIANNDKNKPQDTTIINEIDRYKKIEDSLVNNEELFEFNDQGKKSIAYISKLKSCDWYVVNVIPKNELKKLAGINSSLIVYISIVLLIIIIAIYLTRFVDKNIEKPLNIILHGLDDNFSSISELANELITSSEALSQNTKNQMLAIEQTMTKMHDTTDALEQNTQNAISASKASQNATSSAVSGSEKISLMQENVSKLKESSERISSIIKVINDIASQTNILALNAAVEAARAGEAGKGFEVVAEEVRKLASKTTDAAKDINEIIGNNVQYTIDCSTIADEAFVSLNEIVDNSEKVNLIISEISSSSDEQSQSLNSANKSINDLELMADNTEKKVVIKNSEIVDNIYKQLNVLNNYIGKLSSLINGK